MQYVVLCAVFSHLPPLLPSVPSTSPPPQAEVTSYPTLRIYRGADTATVSSWQRVHHNVGTRVTSYPFFGYPVSSILLV